MSNRHSHDSNDSAEAAESRESVDWLQDVRFVEPTLSGLDGIRADAVVALLPEGERPPRGVAGLIDWRCGGRLSEALSSAFVTGAAGETLLMPGEGIFPAEKFVFCGAGPVESLDDQALDAFVESALTAIHGLLATRVAVEFPRSFDGEATATGSAPVTALEERMLSQLLEGARSRGLSCEWSLIVRPAVHRALRERLRAEAWRVEDPRPSTPDGLDSRDSSDAPKGH